MVTRNQQLVIDSITSNFESLNSKLTEKSPNALARKIMGQINAFDDAVSDFKANTEAYEIANNALFFDLCSQVRELTDSLELEFSHYNGCSEDYGYTPIRSFKILFPKFYNNTISSGEVSIYFYVKSKELYFSNNIKGLDNSGFTYELNYNRSTEVNECNLFDVISEQIINTFKRYKK
jgi:hypothetical protein